MKKPMLLSNDEFNMEDLDYTNIYESRKRDGVRVEISNKQLLNRSLKVLRNVKIQEFFKEVYEDLPNDVILDAEVYSNTLPCREIAGICNSDEHDVPADLKLYIFGMFHETMEFDERLFRLKEIESKYLKGDRYKIINQNKVHSAQEAMELYDKYISEGFEGAVLMVGNKTYKEGRVTIKQHIGFKIKPHKETDLPIIGVTERFLNLNESQTNELGRSYKRNTVDAKEGTGIAATFICEMPNGETTRVSINGNESYRRDIWKNKNDYIGKYAVVKSMAYGEKTRLRHPRLLSIKEAIEK